MIFIVYNKIVLFFYIDIVVNISDIKFNIIDMEYKKINSFKVL